jgi:hypothetical protein
MAAPLAAIRVNLLVRRHSFNAPEPRKRVVSGELAGEGYGVIAVVPRCQERLGAAASLDRRAP